MLYEVITDLDDTLWAVDPVIRQANTELWEWLQCNARPFTELLTPEDLVEGSERRRQLLEREPEIAHSMSLVRLRLLEQGMTAAGYAAPQAKALAATAFDVFMRARNNFV